MKKLSKKEWIAVAVAVILVGYTLFGGDVMSMFRGGSVDNDPLAAIIDAKPSNNNLIINDIVVGQGPEVEEGKLLTVDYILSLSDGTVIQSSKDFGVPFRFTLGAGEVIPGWEQGFVGMRVGGVRTIVIPPELAYGPNQVGPIPPNSTLVFTVELIDISTLPAQ